MGKLQIKGGSPGNTEMTFDGQTIDLRFLKEIKLDMHPEEGNVLTLKYRVLDVDVDLDEAEVERETYGYYRK